MARLNKAASPRNRSMITTAGTPDTVTAEGGTGYTRDAKGELFLLATTNFVGEDTFYENATVRDARYAALIRTVFTEDPAWLAAFLPWLRTTANMRTAAVVGAAHGALAARAARVSGWARPVIRGVLQRADEPAEFVAWWLANVGRTMPGGIQRGVADAVQRLYNEYTFSKYDSDRAAVRMGDVVDLVHPTPSSFNQSQLFKVMMDSRHHRDDLDLTGLPQLAVRKGLMSLPQADRPAFLSSPEALRAAGMTWEAATGWVQARLDAAFWEALIPQMGLMALVRNLRNFDQAGISVAARAAVASRLGNAEQVRGSRMLPMRFFSAYNAVGSDNWSAVLGTALTHTLANVPALPGRTLVLVDRSGSMWNGFSSRGSLMRADVAALFGTAVALNAANADLVQYGSTAQAIPFRRGDSVLRTLNKFSQMGGTNTHAAMRQHWQGHDRVVLLTDEQSHDNWGGTFATDGWSTGVSLPDNVHLHVWNLAGYHAGTAPAGPRHYWWGGLSDACFTLMPLVEQGAVADWPFEPARQ